MKARIALFVTLWSISNLIASPVDRTKLEDAPLKSIGSGPQFFVDYLNLTGLDDRTYVEFYIQVGYHELQFIKDKEQGNFLAGYELDFSIFDEKGNLIESHNSVDGFHVDTYAKTKSSEKARISLLAFTFDPGKYRIKVVLADLETQKSSKIDKRFVARDFRSKELMISDIQLSQKIELAEDGRPYVKNQRYIEPNAGRTFAYGFSGFYVYFEVYNLDYEKQDESTYTTYFIFHNSKGKKIAQLKNRKAKPGETSAHSLRIPLDSFLNGEYVITVRVRDDQNKQIAESSTSFTVVEQVIAVSQIQPDAVLY